MTSSNLFTLGSDLWLFYPYLTYTWIFHHPIQDPPRPKGTDRLVVKIRDTYGKCRAIRGVEWDEHDRIIYRNTIQYVKKMVPNYSKDGIDFYKHMMLKHEIINIKYPEKENKEPDYHSESATIPLGEVGDIEIGDDQIVSLFNDYECKSFKFNKLGSRSEYSEYKWHKKCTPEPDDDYEDDDPDEYSSEFSLLVSDKESFTRNSFHKTGCLKNLYLETISKISEGPAAGLKKGLGYISVYPRHLNQDVDSVVEYNLEVSLDDVIYGYGYNEKITYNFETSLGKVLHLPGPDSTFVTDIHDRAYIWNYKYDDSGLLTKMSVLNTKKSKQKSFIVEYEFQSSGITKCETSCEGIAMDSIDLIKKNAEQGVPDAQNLLGYCLFEGENIPKDVESSAFWFKKSAIQGHVNGQYNYANALLYGDGVQSNKAQASKWFKKCAKQGHEEGQYNLALLYKKGEGIEKDLEQAIFWFKKCAEQGNINAQLVLGQAYKHGTGVLQNGATSIYWFTKCAEQGDELAQLQLAIAYFLGEEVDQDKKYAGKWFNESAEQGNDIAQFYLGKMYAHGDGMEESMELAAHWFEKSAEQGNGGAQYHLGAACFFGWGVNTDKKRAAKLIKQAMENDYEDARATWEHEELWKYLDEEQQ